MQEKLRVDAATAATLATVNRYNEAFNRHDVDAIMALTTDDCIFDNTSPPDGDRIVGKPAVRAVWEEMFRSSPNAVFDAEEIVACRDRCVVLWVYSWTGEDGIPGHIRGVDIIRVRDGKVAAKLADVKG